MELDHTPEIEIVLDDMFYKCANLQKKLDLGNYLFRGSKLGKVSQFQTFA
jgi:hypothetical protein